MCTVSCFFCWIVFFFVFFAEGFLGEFNRLPSTQAYSGSINNLHVPGPVSDVRILASTASSAPVRAFPLHNSFPDH